MVPCGVGSPLPLPLWRSLVGRPVAKGLDLRKRYSSTELRPARSSKANDSDEYYGDDDDEDGGHDPHPHSPPVPSSRVRMKIIQTRAQAYTFIEPNRDLLGVTTVDTVFARTSQAKHDFQLNKAMDMRCQGPDQQPHWEQQINVIAHNIIASFSSGVEGEGKGKGPCGSLCCGLSFPTPVLWFHVVRCIPPMPPPFAKERGLAWGGAGGIQFRDADDV